MKNLLMISLLFISTVSFAQKNQQTDTLIFYQYIGGKPHMGIVQKEKEIAEKWGFTIEYFFGDCGSTFDYKDEEFRILNEKTYSLFVKKYGENWYEKFDLEVRAALKH